MTPGGSQYEICTSSYTSQVLVWKGLVNSLNQEVRARPGSVLSYRNFEMEERNNGEDGTSMKVKVIKVPLCVLFSPPALEHIALLWLGLT